VKAFVDRAIANGQFCKRRGTKGRSAMAACGQLGNERIRARRFVEPAGAESVQIRVDRG
jgi:adenine C2-methylase RlmN of 23S rRNA A2503 and tRNA A37